MERFIKLTPKDGILYRSVYVNIHTIECVFGTDNGAHITFAGEEDVYLDVKESNGSVMKLIENAEYYDLFISKNFKEDGSP